MVNLSYHFINCTGNKPKAKCLFENKSLILRVLVHDRMSFAYLPKINNKLIFDISNLLFDEESLMLIGSMN